jgi:hypothetical protein
MLSVVVVVVQDWSCCASFNQNSWYCRNTAYCDGCHVPGKHDFFCQRYKMNSLEWLWSQCIRVAVLSAVFSVFYWIHGWAI